MAGEDKSTKKFPPLQNQPFNSIPTMAMFLSLDEFWATSKPKSGGAS